MRRSGLLAFMLVVACGERAPEPRASSSSLDNAPAPGTSEVDRPHVVFTRAALTIERVGVSVTPPVTTPSTPSQETMRSDDPTIVAVDANGALVGMQAGTTQVRALASASVLEVTVLGEQAFQLEPAALELPPNGEATVLARAAAGGLLPSEAVRWRIPSGAPIAVVQGRVMSLGGTGRYELEASIGSATARLPVTVRLNPTDRIIVSPAHARARAGEVVRLRLFGAPGEVNAEWTSSSPEVLASLGGGLFQAIKGGKAMVCATAFERSSCSKVEVRP